MEGCASGTFLGESMSSFPRLYLLWMFKQGMAYPITGAGGWICTAVRAGSYSWFLLQCVGRRVKVLRDLSDLSDLSDRVCDNLGGHLTHTPDMI